MPEFLANSQLEDHYISKSTNFVTKREYNAA